MRHRSCDPPAPQITCDPETNILTSTHDKLHALNIPPGIIVYCMTDIMILDDLRKVQGVYISRRDKRRILVDAAFAMHISSGARQVVEAGGCRLKDGICRWMKRASEDDLSVGEKGRILNVVVTPTGWSLRWQESPFDPEEIRLKKGLGNDIRWIWAYRDSCN